MSLAFPFTTPPRGEIDLITTFAFVGGVPVDSGTLALQVAEQAQDPHILRVGIIVPDFAKTQLEETLASSDFRERLPRRLQQLSGTQLFSISIAGEISRTVNNQVQIVDPEKVMLLFQSGMHRIFTMNPTILDGSRRYHFRKPSGAHSDRFMRVAQALNDAVEVEFIAAALSRFVSNEIRVISCDTPSIAVVGYAALRLRDRFLGSPSPLQVDTFHSYDFFKRRQGRVRADTLYVISATASADLASRFIKVGAKPSQLVTLYSLGNHVQIGSVLCDLTDATSGRLPVIVNYPGTSSCPLCKANIPIVEIAGDQFLPIQADFERIRPKKEDAPAWLSDFINENRGLGVFACHYGQGTLGRTYDLWLHVEKMVESNQMFRRDLVRHLFRTIPVELSRIIYVGDEVSQHLASIAQHFYFQRTNHYVPLQTITEAHAETTKCDGAVLVVTSAVSSGREILAASEMLRDIKCDDRIVFLIGLLRTRTREEARRVRNNLIYTPHRNYRFALHVVEEVYFPDSTRSSESTWTEELQFFQKLMLENPPTDSFVRNQVERRIVVLETSLKSETGGLYIDAFWPAPTDSPLKLRRNFSLFGFDYTDERLTQADVFASLAALLHRLRSDPGPGQRLVQMPFRRAVLDPEVFSQFNDGIVQAAILRAAKSPELDYSIDADLSCEMAGILQNILQSWDQPNGEACIEFLLAICTGRLRLLSEHLRPVLERHARRAGQRFIDVQLSEYLLQQAD